MHYNEWAVVRYDGAVLGECWLQGHASRGRPGGLWSWRGVLTPLDPREREFLFDARDKPVVIELADGARGEAWVANLEVRSGGGWEATVVGNGIPPRAAA